MIERKCLNCDHYQHAAASPSAKRSYEAYLGHRKDYEEASKPPEGFWANLVGFFPGPASLAPFPPYPVPNPDNYGWCRLEPRAVEKGINEWCSHFSPHTEGEEGK